MWSKISRISAGSLTSISIGWEFLRLRVHGLRAHERREAFVEPPGRPPLHRDEVSEPLVRELVIDHLRDPLARGDGRILGVDEERRLAVRHKAPVLHRSGREVGQRDHVELGQRVRDAEPVGEVREAEFGDLKAEAPVRGLARGGPNADLDAVLILGEDPLEVRDHEAQEVRGHDRRGFVGDLFFAAGSDDLLDGHVRERREFLRHAQGHLERRLHVRLVPARERPARVGRLELGGRAPGLLPEVIVRRAVEAVHLIVQRPGEFQFQRSRFLRREGPSEVDGDRLEFFVEADGLGTDAHAFHGHERRAVDVQLDRVQRDAAEALGRLDPDGLPAFELEVRQVRLDPKIVALGKDVAVETVRIPGGAGRSLRHVRDDSWICGSR